MILLSSCTPSGPVAQPSAGETRPGAADGYVKTVTTDHVLPEYPTASLSGALLVQIAPEIAYFTIEMDSTLYGLIFPPGYRAEGSGASVRLVDAEGVRVADSGSTVTFGGGEYPDGRQKWEGPPVDAFWLVSP